MHENGDDDVADDNDYDHRDDDYAVVVNDDDIDYDDVVVDFANLMAIMTITTVLRC